MASLEAETRAVPHLASGLSKEEESRQGRSLLYCLGEEGEDALLALKIVDKAKMKYDEVL